MRPYVTSAPWHLPDKRRYGAEESYRLAAEWLSPCALIADWGGGAGHFRRFTSSRVTVVDGTQQRGVDVVADLRSYRTPSAGILLRHVLDNTFGWVEILAHALQAFLHRMVVVTYTPDAICSHVAAMQGAWPVWHLNPDDLRRAMGALLKTEILTAAAPERVYLLERAA